MINLIHEIKIMVLMRSKYCHDRDMLCVLSAILHFKRTNGPYAYVSIKVFSWD